MSKKGPGRAHREGLTVIELLQMFPDDATAERWFEEQRWGTTGRFCPACGSLDTYEVKNRKPMPYSCRDCDEYFSVKKGTVMQSSKLGLQKWAIAIYLMVTGIKGTSSMKVHRDLGIRQATAWHMMQRIREGFLEGTAGKMTGPVEVDEAYIGGKRSNMRPERRERFSGRGAKGKAIIVGAKERETKKIRAKVVPNTKKKTLHGFIADNVEPGSTVYTDEHQSYEGMPFQHESVKHSAAEYVRGMAHTNGMESFWALMKRGIHGTFHKLSHKHLDRYTNEFAGRNNIRDLDTVEQMEVLSAGMVGKRLTYSKLIEDNGKESGARPLGTGKMAG